jgi:glycosyltransferase involved in cell wall biosynthesis
MRFLILTQYFYPEIGATPVRVSGVVSALKELGHEVEVVTALPNHPSGKIFDSYRGCFYRRDEVDGISVHRIWIYAATGAGFRRMVNYLSFVFFSLFLLFHCRPSDFVWVDSPPPFISFPGYIAARIWGARMLLNVADPWPDTVKELGLVRNRKFLQLAELFEKWSYRVAYRITAVTQGIREKIVGKGVPESKVMFLPNGIDLQMFKIRPPDLELLGKPRLEEKKIILYAGTMGYIHGLDTVLDAAKLLRHRPEIVLILIGGGSEKTRLQKRAREESLENVLFLDPAPVEAIAAWYSAAIAGLVVVLDNPLAKLTRSAKIFSTMASGVPVLHSGEGEGALLVEKAEAGLVLAPGDAEALANGIIQLVDNPEWARSLGLNGRRYAERHLGWAGLVREWQDELLGKKARS